MDIVIRPASSADIPELERIGKDVSEFLVSKDTSWWTREQLEKWFASGDPTLVAQESDRSIVGFILVSIHSPTSKATIENIWVDESLRGQGIAKQLISATTEILEKTGVTYVCGLGQESNLAIESLLTGIGFEQSPERMWWYGKFLNYEKI